MSDKPVAGLVTALFVAPIVACCLAPGLILSAFSGAAAWIGGVDPIAAIVAGLVIAAIMVSLRPSRSNREADVETPSVRSR